MKYFLIFISFLVLSAAAHADPGKVRPGRYLLQHKNQPGRLKLLNLDSSRKRPKRYHRYHNDCFKIKRKNPEILNCEPDFLIKSLNTDPYVFTCTQSSNCSWGLDNINDTDIDLPAAWQITEGNSDTVVAVLDTGADLTHPDLADNIWVNPNEIAGNSIDDDGNGYVDDINGLNTISGQVSGCINNPASPQDDNGHGTHVAGIIAAVKGNNTAISGVAPKVKILPIKILDCKGNGSVANAITAIDYIVDLSVNHGIKIEIFNNSWGGVISESELLRQAFEKTNQAGMLATAAAGNGDPDGIGDNINNVSFIPARLNVSNIIAVASHDFSGKLSVFSNFGSNSVHLAAPGGSVRSLLASGTNFGSLAENGTTLASGTSMATPFVSGVLALMKAHLTSLSSAQIRDRLLNRVYPLGAESAPKVISGGRLNAYFALTGDEIPVPTPLPTFTPTNTRTPQPTATSVSTAEVTAVPSQTPIIQLPAPLPDATATPDIGPGFQTKSTKLNIYPVSLIGVSGEKTNLISAAQANLLSIELAGNAEESSQLNISSGKCLIKSRVFSGSSSSALLRLNGQARKVTELRFTLADLSKNLLLDSTVAVQIGKKQTRKKPAKISCKTLKKNIILTGKD